MTKVTFTTADTTLLIPAPALSTYKSKHNAVARMRSWAGYMLNTPTKSAS